MIGIPPDRHHGARLALALSGLLIGIMLIFGQSLVAALRSPVRETSRPAADASFSTDVRLGAREVAVAAVGVPDTLGTSVVTLLRWIRRVIVEPIADLVRVARERWGDFIGWHSLETASSSPPAVPAAPPLPVVVVATTSVTIPIASPPVLPLVAEPDVIASAATSDQGIIVLTPDVLKKLGSIEAIRRSFSDPVTVKLDSSGRAGTLQPVFRPGVATGEYIFIVTPVNQ